MTENTAIACPGSVDPFEAFADALAPRHIIGKLLKFSKGDYLCGEKLEVIPIGTTLTANLDEMLSGWIKWRGGQPTEHTMVRIALGAAPPKRSELGDNDESSWELDNSGQPKDPWTFTNYLPLMAHDGELFTFTTSSRGGLGAVADLSRRYAKHRRNNPDVFPIIALEVGSYEHAQKAFGRIKFPVFKPMGYEPKSRFVEALAGSGVDATQVPTETQINVAAEMKDSISY
jgi:hypothetical protein